MLYHTVSRHTLEATRVPITHASRNNGMRVDDRTELSVIDSAYRRILP